MTTLELKKRLLATTYFLENVYFSEYLALVSTSVRPEVFKTQSHHILPKTYFKHFKLPVDDTSDNLVELLYCKHIYAHWLLTKCTKGFLLKNCKYALR